MPAPLSRRDLLRMAGAGAAGLSLGSRLPAADIAPADSAGRRVSVDFSREIGRIKPLHGVNNGPINWGGRTDLTVFHKEAGFPHVRLHDPRWPSPDVVDIPCIFPLFHEDPDDPANYLFARTDDYLKSILDTGAQIVYRLGVSIEATGHYHTHPPKDYAKWARICVNIIRHYNEGWANGFRHNIRYWEIWNEPNVGNMWSGTRDQYFELYETAAKAIKAGVPSVKVGGPAIANPAHAWTRPFLQFCRDRKVPLDFFSWHLYTASVTGLRDKANLVRGMLDEFSFKETESHCNEWHYLNCPWGALRPQDPRDYGKTRAFFDNTSGPAGAAFCAAVLMVFQDCGVDVANYYTGDTSRWGLFDEYGVPRKTYHAFRAFHELCKTPRRVACSPPAAGEKVAMCAGLDDDRAAAGLLLSNAGDADTLVSMDFQKLPWETASRAEVYRVDADSDFTLTTTESLEAGRPMLVVKLPKAALCLIRLRRS